jgi:hypothetical protein
MAAIHPGSPGLLGYRNGILNWDRIDARTSSDEGGFPLRVAFFVVRERSVRSDTSPCAGLYGFPSERHVGHLFCYSTVLTGLPTKVVNTDVKDHADFGGGIDSYDRKP